MICKFQPSLVEIEKSEIGEKLAKLAENSRELSNINEDYRRLTKMKKHKISNYSQKIPRKLINPAPPIPVTPLTER